MTKGWQENQSTIFEDIERAVDIIENQQVRICDQHVLLPTQIIHLKKGFSVLCLGCGIIINPIKDDYPHDYNKFME